MKFIVLFLSFIFLVLAQNYEGSVSFINNKWVLRNGIDKSATSFGSFEDTINSTGWGVLRIQSNPSFSDLDQMFAAGYLECSLTAKSIYEMYLNMNDFFFKQPPSQKLLDFFDEQDAWVRKNIAGNFSTLTDYWKQVALIISQFDGCVQGYTDNHANNQRLPLFAFRMLNGVGDLLDLINAVDTEKRPNFDKMNKQQIEAYVAKSGHCSGFIKLTGDFSQLYSGHSSWFVYAATLRIYKHYFFDLNSPFVAAKKMSFSSYPGFLESLDDFYILGSGLVMVQTTNSIFNFTLYDAVKPQSLFAWQRVRLANHMAKTGEEWSTLVSQYNSGTYNNQYMVINYNLFKPNHQIPDGLLWVVEQIPGLMKYGDQTELLRYGGFWASYNVPFYTEIYNLSGYPGMVEKYGDCMSYQLAPRARIFRRDADKAVDFESFKAILRYNDYKNDPYSQNNPMWAICSRGDLQSEGAAPFGCYDTKATSFDRVPNLISEAINGPTTSGGVLPPFSWSQFPTHYHFGEPNLYNFSFVEMNPKWN